MVNSTKSLVVFLLYVQSDESLLLGLVRYLQPSLQQGYIRTIDTYRLRSADELRLSAEEDEVLPCISADLIFLLISPECIAICSHYGSLIQQLMQRQRDGSAHFVLVLMRHVALQGTDFETLPALPKKGEAVTNRKAWRNRDLALFDRAPRWSPADHLR